MPILGNRGTQEAELLVCPKGVSKIKMKFRKAFDIQNSADLEALDQWICATKKALKAGKPIPPPNVKGRVWAMIDSGSEPTVANCQTTFPGHAIRPSAAQKRGVRYVSATGGTVPNEGEVEIVHRDPILGDFNFTFQHAQVGCPIISVRDLVGNKKCKVIFGEDGGVIKFPDGRKIHFILRNGVLFVLLRVVEPSNSEPVFSRQETA